ncbi:MAG: DUF2007 domain-containing protein [Acidobacteriota bacterium]
MQRVFSAQHPAEAQFVKGLLENEAIDCEVRGCDLFALGSVSASAELRPSVCILDEQQLDRARELVLEYERATPAPDPLTVWRCRQCDELLEAQFSSCWKCGTPHSREE